MRRLCGPYLVELVLIHLSRSPSAANAVLFRIQRGEILAECPRAGLFHQAFQVADALLDDSDLLVLLSGLQVRLEPAALGEVGEGAAQFVPGELLVERASAE